MNDATPEKITTVDGRSTGRGTGPTPGWVIDVVLAAADAAVVQVRSVYVAMPLGELPDVTVSLERRDVTSAVALFAALGVTATPSTPYGAADRRQAHVKARVPVLGDALVTVIATEGLPSDPAALAAQVDATRAQVDDPRAAVTAPSPDTTKEADR